MMRNFNLSDLPDGSSYEKSFLSLGGTISDSCTSNSDNNQHETSNSNDRGKRRASVSSDESQKSDYKFKERNSIENLIMEQVRLGLDQRDNVSSVSDITSTSSISNNLTDESVVANVGDSIDINNLSGSFSNSYQYESDSYIPTSEDNDLESTIKAVSNKLDNDEEIIRLNTMCKCVIM